MARAHAHHCGDLRRIRQNFDKICWMAVTERVLTMRLRDAASVRIHPEPMA